MESFSEKQRERERERERVSSCDILFLCGMCNETNPANVADCVWCLGVHFVTRTQDLLYIAFVVHHLSFTNWCSASTLLFRFFVVVVLVLPSTCDSLQFVRQCSIEISFHANALVSSKAM